MIYLAVCDMILEIVYLIQQLCAALRNTTEQRIDAVFHDQIL